MNRYLKLPIITCLLALPACQNVVNEPEKTISLQTAMLDIGKSFEQLRQGLSGNTLGVVPCQIDVNFKIGASGKDTTKLGLDFTRTGVMTVLHPSAGYEGVAEASRANDITIKFVHVACLNKDMVAAQDPAKVGSAVDIINSKTPGGLFSGAGPQNINQDIINPPHTSPQEPHK